MTEQLRLRWPVDKHVVTQFFGENPSFYEPFGLPGHEGIDLYAPMNANVYAAADGEVYKVGHPPDHPYGLHIRIKHEFGGKQYQTIYGHLAQASVSAGQQVKTGDIIGLADDTGNSTGSHLHLTLKVSGAQTPGYPFGIVDPWPFFQATTEELPPASDLIIYSTELLSLRAEANIHSTRTTVLKENEALTVLGDADAARARIGRQGEWIQVQTEAGLSGFVAAWFVRLAGQTAPTSPLVVKPTDFLSVRARPSTTASRLTTVSPDDDLQVLGDATSARARIGQHGEWLNVKAPTGHAGYVAAWFVRARETAPISTPSPSVPTTFTVYVTAGLNLRAQPSINSPRVGGAFFNKPLKVLEDDPVAARAKVGQEGQWLFVETEDNQRGWAAAWFLSLTRA
jgi:murein DD-endopeptidase MepM/ murein hydrolase activator NlpD